MKHNIIINKDDYINDSDFGIFFEDYIKPYTVKEHWWKKYKVIKDINITIEVVK